MGVGRVVGGVSFLDPKAGTSLGQRGRSTKEGGTGRLQGNSLDPAHPFQVLVGEEGEGRWRAERKGAAVLGNRS